MSGVSSIQWTDRVWNPVVGCTKVSQGCKHCYAKTLHDKRHKAFLEGKIQNMPQYAAPFETVQLMPERLKDPLSWRKPSKVFVNSVSDLFHEDVPDEYLDRVFAVMALALHQTFQVLTKRSERMLKYVNAVDLRARIADKANSIMRDGARGIDDALAHRFLWRTIENAEPGEWANRLSGIADDQWPLPNVWLGVSVENQAAADERIPLLLQTPAAIRFLSCEPLIDALDFFAWFTEPTPPGFRILSRYYTRDEFDPTGSQPEITWRLRQPAPIDWLIVGGESGKSARPFWLEWVRLIQAQCRVAHVPLFVKQLGAAPVYAVPGMDETRAVNEMFMGSGWAHLKLRDKHGGDISEWPEELRVREFPTTAGVET